MSGLTYESVGVSFKAQEEAIKRIKRLVESTYTEGVLSGLGSFGGLFKLQGYEEPVLVASVDGVGTKLKVAFMMDKHDTVGRDLVAHCGNDIAVQGARPLFFLDYIGCGKLSPRTVEGIVSGLAEGCREIGCALLGGEMAEMPGFYNEGEYDLVGFIVGVVERSKAITGSGIEPGDVIIGLPSSGLHTNGYTLARKALFEIAGYKVDDFIPELGCTVGEELLKVHRSYVKQILTLMERVRIKGAAHITGGGLPDNLSRILPKGCRAVVRRGSWREPPIFGLIQRIGRVSDEEMFHVFNMGVGLCLVVSRDQAEEAMEALRGMGEEPSLIGEIEEGNGEVRIVGG